MNLATATTAELAVELDNLCEVLDWLHESYAETYAQHRSETARYGDSWPGAQLDLAHLRGSIRKAEAQAGALDNLLALRRLDSPVLALLAGPAPIKIEEPF